MSTTKRMELSCIVYLHSESPNVCSSLTGDSFIYVFWIKIRRFAETFGLASATLAWNLLSFSSHSAARQDGPRCVQGAEAAIAEPRAGCQRRKPRPQVCPSVREWGAVESRPIRARRGGMKDNTGNPKIQHRTPCSFQMLLNNSILLWWDYWLDFYVGLLGGHVVLLLLCGIL